MSAISTSLDVTENVVDLMLRRLRRLPDATTDVLRAAACIGNSFDLRTLAVVHSCAPHDAQRRLWAAIQAGLLVPLARSHPWTELGSGGESLVDAHAADIRYRFLHDRVQQAAYSLIDEKKRAELHYTIGTVMVANLDAAELEEHLFDVVAHS